MSFTTFKREKTNTVIRFQGKIRHIETFIFYSFAHDDTAPDFDYGSELENKRELKRFEDGELFNLILRVKAVALGEEGCDLLGQCFVRAGNLEEELRRIATEHDMKNNACKELRDSILSKYETLSEALTGNKAQREAL